VACLRVHYKKIRTGIFAYRTRPCLCTYCDATAYADTVRNDGQHIMFDPRGRGEQRQAADPRVLLPRARHIETVRVAIHQTRDVSRWETDDTAGRERREGERESSTVWIQSGSARRSYFFFGCSSSSEKSGHGAIAVFPRLVDMIVAVCVESRSPVSPSLSSLSPPVKSQRARTRSFIPPSCIPRFSHRLYPSVPPPSLPLVCTCLYIFIVFDPLTEQSYFIFLPFFVSVCVFLPFILHKIHLLVPKSVALI
jgi:hypothetical protein